MFIWVSMAWVPEKILLAGCSKTLRYKAPEIPACGRQAEE